MSLTVVVGPANAGKSGALYGPLVDAALEHRGGVLLLPSHAEVRRARLELATRAPVGISVQTLDGWATQLWSLYGDGRRVTDPLSRRLAAIEAGRAAGPVLADSAKFDGFTQLLAEMSSRSAGMAIAEGQSAVDREIAVSLKVMREVMAEWGLVEIGEVLTSLPEALPAMASPVSVNRFGNLSGQQERFLVKLAERTYVRIGLTYEKGSPSTEVVEPLVHRFREAGATIHQVEPVKSLTELDEVAKALFTDAAVGATGQVRLVETAGPEAEIAAITRTVVAEIAGGTAAERIAVVFRSLDTRWRALESALGTAGLAVHLDMAVPFPATPLGSAALVLLKLAAGQELGREVLLEFLLGPCSDASSEQVELLDASWRRSRTSSTAVLLRDARRVSACVGDAIDAAVSIAANAGVPSANWRTLADSLLESAMTRGRSDAETRLDAAAHQALYETADVLGRAPMSAAAAHATAALVGSTVSTGASESAGAVVVTEAHRIRGRRFDTVVVGGMNHAEFASSGREPLAATLLARLGVQSGSEDRLAERMLFHSIVTRPRASLVLVRQSIDHKGEAARPSQFWDEVLDLYRVEGEERPAPLESFGFGDTHLAMPSFDRRRAEVRTRAVDCGVSAPRAPRGLHKERATFEHIDEFSVTELEVYASCPYRWFYERVMRPRSLDRVFDAREKGSVAHALLARTYRALREEGILRAAPEHGRRAQEVLGHQAEALARENSTALVGIAEELAWSQALRWASTMLEQDEEFLQGLAPSVEEWQFGEAAGRPFALAGVALRGAIDRVDRGPMGIVVTDYKSSKVNGYKSFVSDGNFQVAVYGAAAGSLMGQPVLAGIYRSMSTGKVAGFWNADLAEPDPLVARDAVDGLRCEELESDIGALVAEAAAGIRSGRIEPIPTESACRYCRASDFCGAAQ